MGQRRLPKMFSFGEFTTRRMMGRPFQCVGVVAVHGAGGAGGLAGALLYLNKRLTQWRMRHCASKALRALAWALRVCSTVMYVVPCLWFVAASHLPSRALMARARARPHCRWRRAVTSLRWRLGAPCAIAATTHPLVASMSTP